MDKKVVSKSDFTGIPLATMRNYLKFEATDATEDALITQLMKSAVDQIENRCNIALRETALSIIFDEFDICDSRVILPVAPYVSLTKAYVVDTSGNETESEYKVIGATTPEVYIPTYIDGYKIKIEYTARYTSIPDLAITAILKQVADWYENRGDATLNAEVRKMCNELSYQPWI